MCDIPIVIDYNKPLHYIKQDKTFDRDFKGVENIQRRNVEVFLSQSIVKKKQEKIPEFSFEENSNTIILGTGTNYWCIHFNKKVLVDAPVAKVNSVLKKQLPNSFFWFMNQCVRILDCRLAELYSELIGLEIRSSNLLASCETECGQTEKTDRLTEFSS